MAGWIAGATVLGAVVGASASNKAANTQAAATTQAADLQGQQFERQVQLQEPWRLAGERALGKLEAASDYKPFAYDEFTRDPGYAFRLAEGQKALDRQAAARGGLISGGALKAAQRYGQDMGSQEYMNAFNRYQAERQAKLGPLQSLAGVGQTSVNQLGAAGQNYANAAGEAYMGGANARASGYVGTANAVNQGLGTYLNYTQNQNLLNRLAASNRSTGAGVTNSPYDFSGVSDYS
jgi:hypothetical protein